MPTEPPTSNPPTPSQPTATSLPAYPEKTSQIPPPSATEATPGTLPGGFGLFKPSWQAFKLNFGAFVWAVFPIIFLFIPVVILLGINSFTGGVDAGTANAVSTTAVLISGLFAIIGVILMIVFFIPYTYTLKLQSAKGVKMTLRTNFALCRPYTGKLLLLYIYRGLLILGGFVLLIVPGLFMWRRYMLAPFYLIDENLSVSQAMKKSAADSPQFSSALWGMIGVYVLISVISGVPLIGWLPGTALAIAYCCAQAVRYLQIKQIKT